MIQTTLISTHRNKDNVNAIAYYWDKSTDRPKRKSKIFEILHYYIFVDENEVIDESKYIIETGYETVCGNKIKKVIPKKKLNQEEFIIFRNSFKNSYESDFKAIDRWICEEKPTFSDDIRLCYIDIEIARNEHGRYPTKETADGKITAIGVYDNWLDRYYSFSLSNNKSSKESDNIKYFIFDSENDMLKAFIIFIKKTNPDFFVGWNIVNFDIPYIVNRMKRLYINAEELSPENKIFIKSNDKELSCIIYGRGQFDLMVAAKQLWLGTDVGYSLNAISKKFLNKKKIELEDIESTYNKNFELFLSYNINDVVLCVELNKKLEIIKIFQEFQRIISINLEDSFIASKLIYFYILQNTKYRLNNGYSGEVQNFPGGYVHPVPNGIFNNVYKFDFASMYPSTMISLNISPDRIKNDNSGNIKFETYYKWKNIDLDKKIFRSGEILLTDTELNNKNKIKFACSFDEKEGSITKIMKELTKKRLDAKNSGNKTRATVLKRLINSIYGLFTYKHSRFFSYECGIAVTLGSQKTIKSIIIEIEKSGTGKILLSDTDSIIVDIAKGHSPDEILKITDIVYQRLMKEYNIKNHVWKLELEAKIDRLILFGMRKKYAELVKDKTIIQGLELIKKDTPLILKDFQKEILNYILKNNNPTYAGINDIKSKYVKILYESYNNKNFKYISIPSVIRKGIREYKTDTMPVKALKNSNLIVSIGEVFYIIPLVNDKFVAFRIESEIDKEQIKNIDLCKLEERIFGNFDIFKNLFIKQLGLYNFINTPQ